MQLQDFLSHTRQSVADFAVRAKLSEQAIYKILSGERKSPRRSTIIKIVEATDGRVTANDFYNLSLPIKSKKLKRSN